MDKNRTWPIAKETKKEIITVFVSSSAWYENYSNFDKIADFSTMQSCDHYIFLDLKKWLKEKKEKRKGKGKGKSKEEKRGRDEKSHEEKEKSSLKKYKRGKFLKLQSVRHRAVKDEHYMCIPKLEMYLKLLHDDVLVM
ncbi:hypothetical protein BDQ17DRAFT_1323865 [Cyathus striatus]|nr:hypothetical protein BDQ17DRAFT_1323865 [Cyathus striatus]